MGASWKLLLLASILPCSLCAPLNPPSNSGLMTLTGDCYDYDIPITTQINAFTWNFPEFSDNYDVAGFFSNLTRRDASTAFKPKTSNGHEKTVLVATSGFGFDRRYWASEMNPSAYSFVDYALFRGYSTFIYRGIGQAANAIAILTSLTTSLRQGDFTGSIGQPLKIVHVGHSYGSFLTHSLIADYPTFSDGVILTGIGYNATTTNFPAFFEGARLNITNTVSPERYPGRDSGYLVNADVIGNAATFFHQGNYDKEILWHAQDIAQPVAVIEFVTGSPLSILKPGALAFTRPVMVLSGEFDGGNCRGGCGGILQHPAQEIFGNARAFEAVVHPGSGHGINFNFNATGAYGVMMDFVTKNGL